MLILTRRVAAEKEQATLNQNHINSQQIIGWIKPKSLSILAALRTPLIFKNKFQELTPCLN
jgi:hypothetical protein